MGKFELANGQLAVHFEAANVVGARSKTSMSEEEERLLRWSGVYRPSDAHPLASALNPVLAILRGGHNFLSSTAPAPLGGGGLKFESAECTREGNGLQGPRSGRTS